MASDALLLMLLIAMVTVCGILLLVLLLRGQKGITAAQLDAFERGNTKFLRNHPIQLEQLLRARSHQVGRSRAAENAKQALRTFIHELPKPQKAAADQMDRIGTHSEAKALFSDSRDSTRTHRRCDSRCGN
jgi:plasmid stability protein